MTKEAHTTKEVSGRDFSDEKGKLKNRFIGFIVCLGIVAFYTFLVMTGDVEHDLSTGIPSLIQIVVFIFTYRLADVLYKKWYAALAAALFVTFFIFGWLGILFWGTISVDAYRKIKEKDSALKDKNPVNYGPTSDVLDKESRHEKKDSCLIKKEVFYCNQCGHKLKKDSKFCPQCGTKI